MYLHLNTLNEEQVLYIRACIELKEDPFSGLILPLSNFPSYYLKLQNFQKSYLVYSVEEECHLFLKPIK
jgi:hypothetical protein